MKTEESKQDIKQDELNFPHPEEEKRPGIGLVGMVLSILGWIAMFVLPQAKDTGELYVQAVSLIMVSIIGGLLCWIGRKRTPGMAIIGIMLSSFLLLFMVIGVVGLSIAD